MSRFSLILGALVQRLGAAPKLPSVATYSLLAVLAFVVYWQPLQMHFWGGCDEQGCMVDADFNPAQRVLDHWQCPPGGRPLAFVPLHLYGHYLSPDRVEGFVILAFVLWLSNALLLKAILTRLFPQAPVLGTTAAVLLIVHRAEPMRYWVMWSALFYLLPLFWFLLALWLLLLSFDRRSYWLLALACLSLSISVLGTEGIYPLVILGPALLWFKRDDLKTYLQWTSVWTATATVWAVLFVRYLASQGGASYQARQAGDTFAQPMVLLSSLAGKLWSIRQYAKIDLPGSEYLFRWLFIAAVVFAAFSVSRRWSIESPKRKQLAIVMAAGAVWMFLGILPFLHIRDELRTQFLAAPGQAILWTCVLALVASRLPTRTQPTAWVAALALIAASSGIHSHKHQCDTVLHWPASFPKTTYIFEQIEGIAPNLPQGTLVLLELEDPHQSPLGPNYHVRRIAETVLGAGAAQINYEDPIGETTKLTDDGVVYAWGRDRSEVVSYENVLIFRLERSGALSLVSELPESMAAEARAAYRPLARLSPGEFSELRYLRPTRWHRPVACVTNGRDGVMCGHGWTMADSHDGGSVSRSIADEAELIINPQDRDAVMLEFELAAPPSATDQSPVVFALRDENHRRLAACAAKAGRVAFPLKLASQSVARVFVQASTPNARVSRIAMTPVERPTSQDRALTAILPPRRQPR